MDERILATLKALADVDRLRIAGLLATRPHTREQLALSLRLSVSAVAHHLHRLDDGGLLRERSTTSGSTVFELRADRLADLGRELDAIGHEGETASAEMESVGPDGTVRPSDEVRVLRSFFVDGRLQTIPAQARKRQVVLRYLAETVFTEDREYPEKEVNQLLALRHPDVASLRRYLVDHGYVERHGGRYRVRPRTSWPPLEA